jgi:hypothetical protein
VLRRGNAGSNTAADHITVLDAALTQLPDQHRHRTAILVRADTAGGTREFLAHVRGLRGRAVNSEFSVGWAITGKERAAIATIPAWLWAEQSTPRAVIVTAPGWPRSPGCCLPAHWSATHRGSG